MAAETISDTGFDLRAFAGEPQQVTLADGRQLLIPADPDVDVVAAVLAMRREIEDRTDGFAARLLEAKQLVCRLAARHDPTITTDGLELGVRELLAILSLIVDGPELAGKKAEQVAGWFRQEQGAAFDLRQYAQLPLRVTLDDGVTYAFPADPDVDSVMQMLVLERAIKGHDPEDPATMIPVVDALRDAKQLLVRLAQRVDPEVADLPVGVVAVSAIFAMLTGGETVAEAVTRALTDGMQQEGGAATSDDDEDNGSVAGEGARPLPSRRRSKARSSASTRRTSSRPTGKG